MLIIMLGSSAINRDSCDVQTYGVCAINRDSCDEQTYGVCAINRGR
jgi:hypothetical protein